MYYVLLRKNKDRIKLRNTAEASQRVEIFSESIFEDEKTIRFLYQPYKPEFWYWEIVECTRRLYFTAFLSVVSQNSNIQVSYFIKNRFYFLSIRCYCICSSYLF